MHLLVSQEESTIGKKQYCNILLHIEKRLTWFQHIDSLGKAISTSIFEINMVTNVLPY